MFVSFFQTTAYIVHIHEATGQLKVKSGITLYIANGKLRDAVGSNLYTDEGSKVIFPPTTYIERVLTINGDMIGLDHLYTRGTSILYHTGSLNGNMAAKINSWYQLSSVTVLNTGLIQLINDDYDTIGGLTLWTQYFHMQHVSTMEVSKASTLVSWVYDIEKSGTVTGVGKGYGKKSGPGVGGSCTAGGGAAHGGNGGRGASCSSNYCSGSTSKYDHQCLPFTAGSGGGTCSHGSAGTGGSSFRVVSYDAMFLEGEITMNGVGVAGGGAGSGGSVWMDSDVIEGWGELKADGGNSVGSDCTGCSHTSCCCRHYGGGGGGGRIRTFTGNYTHKVLKHQRYVNGGSGSGSSSAGGIGTFCESGGNVCSGHGTYTSGSCGCNSGYVGNDCQYRCDAATTCSGHGTCSVWGTCVCDRTYVGHRCDSQCHDDTTCSGHGKCTSLGTCVCDACFHGNDCSLSCNGQGQCVGGQCQCNDCYLGEFCESECNEHGSCDINGTCSCTDNWKDAKCTRPGCPSKTSDECSGNGICMAGSGKCYCYPGWAG